MMRKFGLWVPDHKIEFDRNESRVAPFLCIQVKRSLTWLIDIQINVCILRMKQQLQTIIKIASLLKFMKSYNYASNFYSSNVGEEKYIRTSRPRKHKTRKPQPVPYDNSYPQQILHRLTSVKCAKHYDIMLPYVGNQGMNSEDYWGKEKGKLEKEILNHMTGRGRFIQLPQ
ncbi:hypothetical protein Cgig2_001914 [Carnegiea gigantea]|uniref:Uncharacterized protein n=1 Tax=Carnegiea gigantea TaxID=171969 RepID=A0A9Q1QE48_9CARY|nr:hypothetical protein Cgig2_001914 [Carnegiea gigantea]